MSRKIKKIVSVVLLFATVLGLIFALVKCSEIEKRDIYPVFAVGGLNDEGNYLKTTDSIYTKDPFDCRGLTITPGFTSNIKYQVFFYGEQGQFVGKSELLEGAAAIPMSDIAVQARLVIIPFDDDGKNVEIKLWDVPKYSMMAKITVDADQDYEVPNLVELAKQNKYVGTTPVSELKPQQIVEYSYYVKTGIDISSTQDKLQIKENDFLNLLVLKCSDIASFYINSDEENFSASYVAYDGSYIPLQTGGKIVQSGITFEVPTDAEYVLVGFLQEYDFFLSVYQYG